MQLCPVGGEIMVSWSTTFPGVEIWVHHLSDHCSNSITTVKKDLDEWLVSSSNGQVSGSRVQTLSTFNYCIRKDYRVYNKATLDNHEGSEHRGRSWGWNIHWQMCSIRCVVAWYFLPPFASLFRCNILAPLLGWCARDSSWRLSMRQKSCNQSFERISVSKISLPYMLWGESGFLCLSFGSVFIRRQECIQHLKGSLEYGVCSYSAHGHPTTDSTICPYSGVVPGSKLCQHNVSLMLHLQISVWAKSLWH